MDYNSLALSKVLLFITYQERLRDMALWHLSNQSLLWQWC